MEGLFQVREICQDTLNDYFSSHSFLPYNPDRTKYLMNKLREILF